MNKAAPSTVALRVKRYDPACDDKPWYQVFEVPAQEKMSVLDALFHVTSHQDGSLSFRYSCRAGMCGSCAMIINGVERLACKAQVKALGPQITVAPLHNLPVVKDLVVDMEPFLARHKQVMPYLVPKDPHLGLVKAALESPARRVMDERLDCLGCVACYSACPLPSVDKEFLPPAALNRALYLVTDPRDAASEKRLRIVNSTAGLWDCTTCTSCTNCCPEEIPLAESIIALRGLWVETGHIPATLRGPLMNTFNQGNPLMLSRDERSAWAQGLKVKHIAEGAEVLYFVGCSPAYDQRLQHIPQALVKAFRAAGVDFAVLGNDENCCGSEIRRVGESGLFEVLAENNLDKFERCGAAAIITTSPHCFNVFKNEYAELDVPVQHYTQFIARLIADEKLTFSREVPTLVTYHDPCFLGKQNGVFDEPRQIISSIPGLEMREMDRSRERSLCCEGGGGRMWLEATNRRQRLANARVAEAAETGAQVLVTACPFCFLSLEDAVKDEGLEDTMRVRDIMDLVVQAI